MQKLRNWAYHKLRWSERFTKTDMIYLTKGGFWQVFGQVWVSILTLGLTIAFANLLPKETYGLYRYVLSLAGILGVFTLTGMNQAVSQAVAVGDDGALRASVRYQLRWNLIQMAAFWILAVYYMWNSNIGIAASLFVLGIFSPLTLAFNTYGAYLEGKRNFALNNLFSIASTVIYVAGMLLAIILSGQIVWLIAAYATSTFASTLIFYLTTLRKYKPAVSETSDALKFGRELTLISAIGPVVSQIDKIILSHFWGATQLAIYSLAIAVPDRVTSLIKGWVSIGLPKFSTKTPEEINQVFYIRIFQGIMVGTACFSAYWIIAPYIFTFLIPQYLDSMFYSQILAISFIFAIPNRYVSLLLASQKFSKIMFKNNMSQSIIRIVFYILFGILGGIIGLIWANVLMSLAGTIINIVVWRSRKLS